MGAVGNLFFIAPNSHIDATSYSLYNKNNMIDKKDLRIGNSVSYKGEVWKIEELSDTAAHLSQHPLWVRGHYDNLHPIPITEEALVKMGFEKDLREVLNEIYKLNKFSYNTKSKIWYYKWNRIEIDFIHQLQNIIYTLTQTELSYEPTH